MPEYTGRRSKCTLPAYHAIAPRLSPSLEAQCARALAWMVIPTPPYALAVCLRVYTAQLTTCPSLSARSSSSSRAAKGGDTPCRTSRLVHDRTVVRSRCDGNKCSLGECREPCFVVSVGTRVGANVGVVGYATDDMARLSSCAPYSIPYVSTADFAPSSALTTLGVWYLGDCGYRILRTRQHGLRSTVSRQRAGRI